MRQAERASCGVGFVAYETLSPCENVSRLAVEALGNLGHRGGQAMTVSDGCGILLGLERRADLQLAVLSTEPEPLLTARLGALAADFGCDVTPAEAVEMDVSSLPAEVRQWRMSRFSLLGLPERDAGRFRSRLESPTVHVASLSRDTVVFKHLAGAELLGRVYPGLGSLRARFAIFHQRFATNTSSAISRVQPCHRLAHNGEITSITSAMATMALRHGLDDLDSSDSFRLDAAVDRLALQHGMLAAVNIAIPAQRWLATSLAFATPFDGPAAVVATNGDAVIAHQDTNGLRPLRWARYADGLVVVASEIGVVDHASRLVELGDVLAGDSVMLDRSGFHHPSQCHDELARRLAVGPPIVALPEPGPLQPPPSVSYRSGWTNEEITWILDPLIAGTEPMYSMGDDTPPAGLTSRSVYYHLRQAFAQVTGPALDALRDNVERPLLHPIATADGFMLLDGCLPTEGQLAELLAQHWPAAQRIDVAALGGSLGARLDGLARVVASSTADSFVLDGADAASPAPLVCAAARSAAGGAGRSSSSRTTCSTPTGRRAVSASAPI